MTQPPIPEARSETPDPTPIADALAQVRAELGLPAADALPALVTGWVDVVGEDIAAHARLESVHGGAASIVVDDALWASQLRYLETAIRERANALVGEGVVQEVRVRVEHH